MSLQLDTGVLSSLHFRVIICKMEITILGLYGKLRLQSKTALFISYAYKAFNKYWLILFLENEIIMSD